MLAKLWHRLFLAAFGLNVVIAAVLRDSLCRLLLPCVADCYMLYKRPLLSRYTPSHYILDKGLATGRCGTVFCRPSRHQ